MNAQVRLGILITTRNRELCLERLLAQLDKQLQPTDTVCLTDDSDDPQILHTVLQSHTLGGASLVVGVGPRSGVAANRNAALSLAPWDEVTHWTFLDDDLEIPDNYLGLVRERLSKRPLVSITGCLATQTGELRLPREPDYLGFYRGREPKDGDIVWMACSCGTWTPSSFGRSFRYDAKSFYGYDEWDYSEAIRSFGSTLVFDAALYLVVDDEVESTGAAQSELSMAVARIGRSLSWRESQGQGAFARALYRAVAASHHALRAQRGMAERLGAFRRLMQIPLETEPETTSYPKRTND